MAKALCLTLVECISIATKGSKSSASFLPSFGHDEFHMHVNLIFWNSLIFRVVKFPHLSAGDCCLKQSWTLSRLGSFVSNAQAVILVKAHALGLLNQFCRCAGGSSVGYMLTLHLNKAFAHFSQP